MKKILMAIILLCAVPALAVVPGQINFQGILMNPGREPINHAGLPFTFSIYSVPTGGSAIWTETQSSVTVEGGMYSVRLGTVIPIPSSVFDGNTKYLGIAAGSDGEMTPRILMVSVPYAYRAASADAAAAVDDNVVSTAKIQNGAVTDIKLANNAVTQPAINAGTPSTNQFLRYNGSGMDWAMPPSGGASVEVDNSTVVFNASGSLEVKNLGIDTPQLAANAVTAAKLANNAVTQPSIAAGSPSANQFLQWNGSSLDWAVPVSAEVDNSSVDLTSGSLIEVKNLGITNGKLAANAVTQAKINAGSPSTGQFLQWNGSALQWAIPISAEVDNSSVDLTSGSLIEVKNLGITNGKLADNAVTQSKINAGSPSTGQLLQWSGSALQWGSPLVDNSTIDLTSGQLEVAALGITNGKIANTTITGGKLASGININTTGSVSANNLTASGNVTATALVSGESVKARKFYCTEAGGVNAFAGTGTILSGSNSSTISSNIISSNSIILLTVGSGAGQVAGIIAGLKVSFVNPGIDFTVKTLDNTNAPAAGIPFSYMIIN